MESSVGYFKAALLERLQDDEDLAGDNLAVSWGNPHPAKWAPEQVIIGSATNRRLEYTCAFTQANETYDVEIIVNVSRASGTPYADIHERASEIMNLLTSSLVSWVNTAHGNLVGGDWGKVNGLLPGTGGSDQEGLDKDGRDCTITQTVNVIARLI